MKPSILFLSMLASTELMASDALAPIVVEAGLIEVEADDLTRTVSVMSREDIAHSGLSNAADLIARLPGVSIDRNGTPGLQTNISIHGQRTNSINVMIDGQSINNTSDGSSSELGGLSAAMIERIEVVRGGNSALGGNNALSGSINIVTRKSSFIDLQSFGKYGDAYAYGLSFGDQNAKGFVQMSGGHNREQHARTATPQRLDYTEGGGHVETAYDSETDENEAFNLSTGLDIELNERLSAEIRLRDGHSEIDTDDSFATPTGHTRNHYMANAVALKYQQDPRFSHRFSSSNYEQNAVTTGSYPSKNGGQREKLDYQFNAKLEPVELALSAQREDREFNKSGVSKRTRVDSNAIELRGQAPRLNYYLGYRQERSSDFDAFDASSIGATFFADDQFEVFANLSRNHRNPGMTDVYGWNNLWNPNPDLQPERDKAANLGLRWFGASASLEAAVYQRKVDNKMAIDWANSVTKNIEGESKISGVEISGEVAINDHLTLKGQYTNTEAKDSDGEPLVLTPEHTATLSGVYQKDQITTSASASYHSETNNTYYAPDFSSHKVTLDARSLVNLGLDYALDEHHSVGLQITNAFDDDNITVAGYEGAGRMIGLHWRSQF